MLPEDRTPNTRTDGIQFQTADLLHGYCPVIYVLEVFPLHDAENGGIAHTFEFAS